jgi:hypothetical protein
VGLAESIGIVAGPANVCERKSWHRGKPVRIATQSPRGTEKSKEKLEMEKRFE